MGALHQICNDSYKRCALLPHCIIKRMVDRYRNYQPRYTPRRKQRRKPGRAFVFALLVVIALGVPIVWKHLRSNGDERPRSSNVPRPKPVVTAEPIASTTWNELNQRISAIINEHAGLDISAAIIDINSNTKANYGIQDNFHGASTTKVLTAAAYLHDVEQAKRTLTENLGGGSAETHIRRMINRSDNTSWEILNRAVGYARLDAYAHANGISSFKYYGNLMTASDQALLLSKLFQRQLLNEPHTKLLLSFMQTTNNEDMIPVVLPEGATLYHKYGQLDDRLHDSAIINYKNQPIVLVIYTKGTSDGNAYTARTQLVQEIARSVFTTIYQN